MKKIYLIFSMVFFGSVVAFAQGDDCASAVTVTAGTHTANGPQSGGGNISGCGINGGTNADWYEFTPVCDGVMSVSNNIPANPSPGVRLTIRSGSCASLACVANSPAGGNNGTINNISVTGGTTYYIEFDDSWNGAANSPGFDWTLDFTVSNAPTPSVSAQTYGAFATWIPFGNEAGWDIQYGPSGFNLGTGTQVNIDSAAPGNQYEITGLTPETTYDYYIAIEGTGCWVGPISFTTLAICPPPTAVNINALNTSAILSWTAGGGTPTPPGSQPGWNLQLGPVGTPIGDNAMIYDETLSSSAFNAQSLSSCTDYHMYVREVCDATTSPQVTSLWVGPIVVSTGCVCPEPSDLGAVEDTNNAFNYNLFWTPGGSENQWNVQWGPSGFLFGTGTTISVGSDSSTISGFTPNTQIDYYVQAACGSTDDSLSAWVGPFTFTTNVFCPTPTGLGANNITTISANVFWNVSGTTTDYTIEYGPSGFTQGSGTIQSLQSTTATLNGLTPDSEYCFYVQSNCGATADSSSHWAGPYCFYTLAACPVPTNLEVLNISNTSATLNWQPGGSETMWDVEWGFPGFTPGAGEEEGSGSTNTTSDLYVTGLNAAAPYCYYVRAACGGLDGNSNWAGPFCFSTLLSNDLPCGAIELLTDGNINLHTNEGATVNGEDAIAPGYSTAINSQLDQVVWYNNWQNQNGNIEAPVWFKFKAPASGKVEVSTFNEVTDNAGTRTEIALYAVGNCNVLSNFSFIAANTYANRFGFNGNPSTSNNAPRGSRILACDLNPGQYYYVLVDNYSGPSAGMSPGVFGISVTDIPEPNSGVATPLTLCGDGTPVDLFDAIDEYSTTTGTWYNPSADNPGFTTPGSSSVISLPSGAGTYTFDYVIANACGTDTVTTSISTVAGPNAGMDGYFETCNTDDVILLNHIQGFADLGGTWSDVNGQYNVANGVFHAYGLPYGTYSFYYIVAGNGVCPADTAVVSINLNDNCLGLDDDNASALEIYPNPVNNILTIANLSIEGNASVMVYDAQGKLVISQDVSNHSGNYTVDMTQLEAGLYVVELNAEKSTEKVRVIKQ